MIKVTCQTQNIIYLITCITCKIQFVGQTKKNFQGHHDIQHDNDTTVDRNFKRCPHESPLKFNRLEINVFQFIWSPPDSRDGFFLFYLINVYFLPHVIHVLPVADMYNISVMYINMYYERMILCLNWL